MRTGSQKIAIDSSQREIHKKLDLNPEKRIWSHQWKADYRRRGGMHM